MSTVNIQALIAKLEIEANLVLEANNPEDILELSDLFLRLTGKKSILEKVELAKENLLNEQAEKINFGETFKIGLREFQKTKKYSNGKLDMQLLEQLVPDESNRSECYKTQPKNKDEVEKLLKTLGVNAPIEQLYAKELQDGFKIKPKN
jgi:hypothetical protein